MRVIGQGIAINSIEMQGASFPYDSDGSQDFEVGPQHHYCKQAWQNQEEMMSRDPQPRSSGRSGRIWSDGSGDTAEFLG